MKNQTCKRCKAEEYIPTYQFVKFEDEIRYLCSACWYLFHQFYYRGAKFVHVPSEEVA